MSFGPVRPARIDFADAAAPRAPDFGDVYHSRAGALAQARHVFLGGNGLPARWAGRGRFVVLETGFGLGHNFLATWATWRADASRSERLWFVSLDKHPPHRDDLARALAGCELREHARELVAAWPPLTPDLHLLDFDDARVRLLLAFGDVAQVLPELVLQADAVYLDGFAPNRNPAMWDSRLLSRLPRLLAPGATLATWSVARPVRDALSAAGFEVSKAPGFEGKREMTVAAWRPRHLPPVPPGRQPCRGADEALVVGAGLAGAAAAFALAREGLAVRVLERHASPAAEASGNAGGLFHGVVHRGDAPHARWFRAAALRAQRVLAPWASEGRVAGRVEGLLRGESALVLDAMQSIIDAQGLPPDWVQALSAGEASRLARVPFGRPAWMFPGGGWVSPADLVRAWLDHPRIRVETHHDALSSQACATHEGPVIWAAGTQTAAALNAPPWPHDVRRGQTTVLPRGLLDLPLPLADQGYALQLDDGRVLCGASGEGDDADAELRAQDHLANLDKLARLVNDNRWRQGVSLSALEGRAGCRLRSQDRLPWVGPVPDREAELRHVVDQPRQLPRRSGHYVLSALGSRGITQAALAGEALASWITGAPMPLPASLIDAIDPARFGARAARRRPPLPK